MPRCSICGSSVSHPRESVYIEGYDDRRERVRYSILCPACQPQRPREDQYTPKRLPRGERR